MDRNVRRYPLFVAGVSTYAWVPVFFLYLNLRLPIDEVLALEAVYYTAVVVLEVPSGYASDRFGRRLTLILACTGLVSSYVLFALGSTFGVLAAAQCLMAAGIAFRSGTDTAFFYESLTSCGLEDEYPAREARVQRLKFLVTAGAALAGGAVGLVDLRLAYVIAATGAVLGLVVAFTFEEPPRDVESGWVALGPGAALIGSGRALRDPTLRWIFAFMTFAVVLNHIPYELFQPYLGLLGLDISATAAELTPLVAGVHLTVGQLVAASAAGRSMALAHRFGTAPTLLGAMTLQALIIGSLALWLHPLVALLLVLRSAPQALCVAPVNATVTPRVAQALRATYLSVQSLSGRLAFAGLLAVLSLAFETPEGTPSWPVVSGIATVGLAASLVALLALLPSRPRT